MDTGVGKILQTRCRMIMYRNEREAPLNLTKGETLLHTALASLKFFIDRNIFIRLFNYQVL